MYKIIDSTIKLSSKDWYQKTKKPNQNLKIDFRNRVVAVFAMGASWQFKGWKWADPVPLFTNTCGFHLKYEDDEVQESIRSWNVRILTVENKKKKFFKTF